MALDYGYKWFEYHAQQRITTFNFYLTVYSGMAAAYSFLLKEDIHEGSILVSLLMLLMSILFWQLDVRNRQLIEIGEDVVSGSWAKAGLKEDLNPITQARMHRPDAFRFRQLFVAVFLVGGTVGLVAFGYAVARSG
jgi:hypothetical protein